MVFLDDATVENGCLEVAAGTPQGRQVAVAHRRGRASAAWRWTRPNSTTAGCTPLEVPAGTVAYFGAFLVHRSLPNRSGGDRRALLYSYQPAGHPHMLELNGLLQKRAVQ